MKRMAPYIFAGLGVAMLTFAFFLRNGAPEADVVITNLASSFMGFAGGVCLLVGLVLFFMKDQDGEEW